MSVSDFFNSGDGLTTSATLESGDTLVGYFDIDLNELYADASNKHRGATFMCEIFTGSAAIVNQTLTVDSVDYAIQNVTPDGTGLVVLALITFEE